MTDLTLDIADKIATGTLAAGVARKAQPLPWCSLTKALLPARCAVKS